jgi:hypothetical protein
MIRFRSLLEARLINEAQFLEAGITTARVESLEQIEKAEAFLRHSIPELLITAAPQVPGIAPFDFLGVRPIAPSIGLKTSSANSGKSDGLRPPPSSMSELCPAGTFFLQPVEVMQSALSSDAATSKTVVFLIEEQASGFCTRASSVFAPLID